MQRKISPIDIRTLESFDQIPDTYTANFQRSESLKNSIVNILIFMTGVANFGEVEGSAAKVKKIFSAWVGTKYWVGKHQTIRHN